MEAPTIKARSQTVTNHAQTLVNAGLSNRDAHSEQQLKTIENRQQNHTKVISKSTRHGWA